MNKEKGLVGVELQEVQLPPINGKILIAGMISDSYKIGGSRRGAQKVPIYDHRIIPYIAEMAKSRVRKKFDCPILIAGQRRTGKTTNAIAIARELNPRFTSDLIAFRLEDFRKILANLPPAEPENDFYPVAILDESGVDLYSKDWQQRLQKEMVKVFQIIGKKRLTMILCLPHRNLLTKDIREAMHLWIQTKTDMDGERGFAELREGCDNIWQLELYWKPLCGFCYNQQDDDFWDSYEERKDAFIEEFIQLSPVPDASHRAKVMEQRDNAIKLMVKHKKDIGLNARAMSKVVGMSEETMSKIVNIDKKVK